MVYRFFDGGAWRGLGTHEHDLCRYQWVVARFAIDNVWPLWVTTSNKFSFALERWFAARDVGACAFMLRCGAARSRRVLNYRLVRAAQRDGGMPRGDLNLSRWFKGILPRYCAMRAHRGLNLVGWETLRLERGPW